MSLAGHAWWLASRASGILALVLLTISVGLGLTMAGKFARRPGIGRTLVALHEQTALAGLLAIAVHGLTLLGDPWLNPGLKGIAIPFTMAYRPLWTGAGIVAGYVAALLGLSFYLRRRIGARLWRQAHRFTVVAYLLGLVHVLGSGTDASTPWLRGFMLLTAPVIAAMFVARVIGAGKRVPARRPAPSLPVTAPAVRTAAAPVPAPAAAAAAPLVAARQAPAHEPERVHHQPSLPQHETGRVRHRPDRALLRPHPPQIRVGAWLGLEEPA